jgi:fatty acid desaturase
MAAGRRTFSEHERRTFTMEERRTPNPFNRKPWRYLYAVLVGGAGVIMFVLGFNIPGWQWLTWLGFAFILATIYFVRSWFIGPILPSAGPISKFFVERERETDDLLPPTTV